MAGSFSLAKERNFQEGVSLFQSTNDLMTVKSVPPTSSSELSLSN